MNIPANFDPSLTLAVSAKLHNVTVTSCWRWRNAMGFKAPVRDDAWADDDVRLLKQMYSGHTLAEIAATTGRSINAVKSKALKIGLRRATGHFAPDRAPQIRGRVQGRADMAAQHVSEHDRTPVYHCDADGTANPKGDHWRYGNAILTEDELFAKAERKGWNPDAWREIA